MRGEATGKRKVRKWRAVRGDVKLAEGPLCSCFAFPCCNICAAVLAAAMLLVLLLLLLGGGGCSCRCWSWVEVPGD